MSRFFESTYSPVNVTSLLDDSQEITACIVSDVTSVGGVICQVMLPRICRTIDTEERLVFTIAGFIAKVNSRFVAQQVGDN